MLYAKAVNSTVGIPYYITASFRYIYGFGLYSDGPSV